MWSCALLGALGVLGVLGVLAARAGSLPCDELARLHQHREYHRLALLSHLSMMVHIKLLRSVNILRCAHIIGELYQRKK